MSTPMAHLSNLLVPTAPSAALVCRILEGGLVEISPEDATMLLEKWGTAWSKEEDRVAVEALSSALLKRGADPWQVPRVMDRWVDDHRVELMKKALILRLAENYPAQESVKWLSSALAKCHNPMLQVLLDHGVRQLRGEKGNFPLHKARDAQSSMILMKHGADPSLSNLAGKFPIEEWDTPWEKETRHYKSMAARLFKFCLVCMDTPRGLRQPGLDAAPVLLAGFGDVRSAIATASLSRSGFETTTCAGFAMGASPLAGWCWSVFGGDQSRPSSWASRILIDRCFAARDGIWDHEWVFAVAALDVMQQKRAGGLYGLAAPIRARQMELATLPALDGSDRSRWDAALQSLNSQLHQPDTMASLARKTVYQFFQSLARGQEMLVSPCSLGTLNKMAASNSSLMSTAINSEWSSAIPKSFWEQQGNVCPAWLQSVPQDFIVRHVRECIASGANLPGGLVPTSRWSPDMIAALDAYKLSSTTPPATVRPSRRM